MTAVIIVSLVVGYLGAGFLLSRYAARWSWSLRIPGRGWNPIDAKITGWTAVFFWPVTFLVLAVIQGCRSCHVGNINNWIMRDVDLRKWRD